MFRSSNSVSGAELRSQANGLATGFMRAAEALGLGAMVSRIPDDRIFGPPNMALNFPNASRSYDERRDLVRFWGHDEALEVAFFVDVKALRALSPAMLNGEAGYLAAFDAALDRIHASARKVYSKSENDAYLLGESDF